MYLGRIVETADKATIFTRPGHPYTEALLSAIPVPDPTIRDTRPALQGDVPSPVQSAERLPLPHPLPDRGGALQRPRRRCCARSRRGQHVACHLR